MEYPFKKVIVLILLIIVIFIVFAQISKLSDYVSDGFSKIRGVQEEFFEEWKSIHYDDAKNDVGKREKFIKESESSVAFRESLVNKKLSVSNRVGEMVSYGDIEPKRVVLHHTVGTNLNSVVDWIIKEDLSVHFILDKDGKLYQFLDINSEGAHACGANFESVGIEIINSGYESFTSEQYKTLEVFLKVFRDKVSGGNVIGHFEVPNYYSDTFSKCENKGKWDPSPYFDWGKIGETGHPTSCSVVPKKFLEQVQAKNINLCSVQVGVLY